METSGDFDRIFSAVDCDVSQTLTENGIDGCGMFEDNKEAIHSGKRIDY